MALASSTPIAFTPTIDDGSTPHTVSLTLTNSTKETLNHAGRILTSGTWHIPPPTSLAPQKVSPDVEVIADYGAGIEGISAYDSPDIRYIIVFYFSSIEPYSLSKGHVEILPKASTTIDRALMAEMREASTQKTGKAKRDLTSFGRKYELFVEWNAPAEATHTLRYQVKIALKDVSDDSIGLAVVGADVQYA